MTKKKILLIDDMPNAAVMLKARLETSGYEVITALDGQQGLTYANAKRPDLIILDIVMPTGGGYSVFTRLKRSPKTRSIPVIFLTAKDAPEDVSRAYKLGAQYYLKKPYKADLLLETVKKALEPVSIAPPRGRLRKRVLVIGRESEMAGFSQLGEVGYEVIFVSNLKEGSDEAREEKPDLILLDGMLVKSNNFDGFYQFKLEFALSDIPVILSVTREELEEFQKRLDGFNSYCLTPIQTTELLGQIRMVLQKG